MRPDLPALREAMQRAALFAEDEWLPVHFKHYPPVMAQHILDCHNWFLTLANYVIFNEQRLADLRGK